MEDTPGTGRKRRRGTRGPTVSDVARLAGVSAMTVSRAVNRDSRVAAETQERVMAAVAALGYVPNQAARSLASGRQARLALLHANPSAAWLSELLMGGMAEAAACDAQLVVEQCGEADEAEALASRLAGRQIDGVLLPAPLCDRADLVAALVRAGLPVVQIATGKPLPGACAVTIDDEAAAHAMTARLIGFGHRRIGFVAGNPNQTASALRRAGFEAALREAGIAPDPALVVPGDFSYRSGLAAAERLLALPAPPTAIFASNDDMAAAAVAACHRHRIDVPGDVSVCGFDDTAMATTIWPELTTIRQPVADMARRAVRLLVDSDRECRSDACRDQLAFALVSRGSDAPLRPA